MIIKLFFFFLVRRKFFAGREQQEKEKNFLKCKLAGNPLGKESDSPSLRGAGLPVQAASAAWPPRRRFCVYCGSHKLHGSLSLLLQAEVFWGHTMQTAMVW